jgi:hypothetical protein
MIQIHGSPFSVHVESRDCSVKVRHERAARRDARGIQDRVPLHLHRVMARHHGVPGDSGWQGGVAADQLPGASIALRSIT